MIWRGSPPAQNRLSIQAASKAPRNPRESPVPVGQKDYTMYIQAKESDYHMFSTMLIIYTSIKVSPATPNRILLPFLSMIREAFADEYSEVKSKAATSLLPRWFTTNCKLFSRPLLVKVAVSNANFSKAALFMLAVDSNSLGSERS